MKIINLPQEPDTRCSVPVLKCNSTGAESSDNLEIAAEHSLRVYINGVLTMRIVCTPNLLPELIIGRLWSEGMIDSIEDIQELKVSESGSKIEVLLTRTDLLGSRTGIDDVSTCCSGSRDLSGPMGTGKAPQNVCPISWKPEWIYALAQRFEESTPLYASTGSTHSCMLARNDEILYDTEDLGRHNAMDKAIGCALRDKIDLTKCILYSSGRLPTDMVSKAIRAGIPILCTKAMVTDKAIEMANRYSLTLIFRCRADKYTIASPIK